MYYTKEFYIKWLSVQRCVGNHWVKWLIYTWECVVQFISYICLRHVYIFYKVFELVLTFTTLLILNHSYTSRYIVQHSPTPILRHFSALPTETRIHISPNKQYVTPSQGCHLLFPPVPNSFYSPSSHHRNNLHHS